MRVLVTGSSTGIGLGIVKKFVEAGHEVIGFDRNITEYSALNYLHYQLDIRDEGNYPQLPPIDILINNAGTQNEEDIDVNLRGTMKLTEHYGVHEGVQAILMIGSASAHTGSEFPEYAASKGGLLSYTKNVALRVAPYGATCNSLDFGGVLTELNQHIYDNPSLWEEIMDLTPMKRWMTVNEAADWAYFMTVTNRFCTGQNILIDGLEAGNAHFVW